MDKTLFESKAWKIVDSEGMIFVVNKRFESEGRYEAMEEVTADMVDSFEFKGVKVPNYIRKELTGIFAEMEVESIEEPIDGLVAERPYLALKEMAIERADQNIKTNVVIMRIHKDNLKRYILALSHLNVPYYEHEQINDELVEIIHDEIEKPFEEEVETMLEQREIIPIEIKAKLNLFSRYNELLMKSLKFNLSSEEQYEYNSLYEELKLNEGHNLYELMKASYEQRNA